jgi:hypothetical protein
MFKKTLSYLWKIPLCALAFYGGTMIGGMVASGLGLSTPELPAGADQMIIGQIMLLVSLILAGCLAIISRKLSGGFVTRWLTLSFLVWIAYGVNNVLEGAIFTSLSSSSMFMVVLYIFASLLCGAAVAWLFPPQNKGVDFFTHTKNFFSDHTTRSWVWRILAAFLAFPLIYLAFGRLIAPLVIDYYEQGLFGLSLPGWNQILPILFIRSFLFLIACLPVLIIWQGSNRSLFLTLDLSLFLLVGGLSMLQAYWMPSALRIIHSLEILADEMVYSAILVALLISSNRMKNEQHPQL